MGRDASENGWKNAEDRVPRGDAPRQDTRLKVVFMEVGQDVHFVGGGAGRGGGQRRPSRLHEGDLVKSSVRAPFPSGDHRRQYTRRAPHTYRAGGHGEDHARAERGRRREHERPLHAQALAGPSGRGGLRGGHRLQGRAERLPADGGGRRCGGTFEGAALLAKKALLAGRGSANPEPRLAELEDELEGRCNDLGIGPQGLGGRITVMDVFVEETPAHIASLPVAVNIQCHSARHKEAVL